MDALENLFHAQTFQLAVTLNPGLKKSVYAAQRMAVSLSNAKHARAAPFMVVRIIRTAISPHGKDLSSNLVQNVVVCLSLQVSVKPNVQIARKPSTWKRSFLKWLNSSLAKACPERSEGSILHKAC